MSTATPAAKPVEGEHIFAASELTPLAIRWKELNKQGREDEAMVILEKLIIGSTEMFQRLAQHEKFHQTVDLNILIAAAQEKMVKWLTYWEPDKGLLFSWLSKSLSGDSKVWMDGGHFKTLSEIVNNKLEAKVLCYGEDTSTFYVSSITGWHKHPVQNRDTWRRVTATRPGFTSSIFATHDHEFLTQRGWIEVDHIQETDVIYGFDSGLVSGLFGLASKCVIEKVAIEDVPDGEFRYDITVEKRWNFVANGIIVHNCSKNAFRAEVVKALQFRKKIYTTDDNVALDRLCGSEDHDVDKHDAAAEFQLQLKELSSRWGGTQEIATIKFLIECIIDDSHNKQAAIRAGSYAYGTTVEMSRFFYNWATMSLRDIMYEKAYIPFSDQDLLRHNLPYTFIPDLLNIVTWDQLKRIIAVFGGTRLKIPRLVEIIQWREDYELAKEIEMSDLDPDTISRIAKKRKRTDRSAHEIFSLMSETSSPLNHLLSGEYPIYE